FVMTGVLASDRFRARVRTIAPSRKATLYLVGRDGAIPVAVRGGIPSREAAIGDPEVAGQTAWTDTDDDARWLNPAPGDLLRAMDRFHPPPRGEPSSFDDSSWAEWLYFNGRSPDGALRFYLTFLTSGPTASGTRLAFVRLQVNRNGETTNYFAADQVDAKALLERAPD